MGDTASIRRIFSEVDKDGSGELEWNSSEIRTFIALLFKSKGLPVPKVDERTWYSWYREVDHDHKHRMSMKEADEYAKHIFERILQLNGKTLKTQPVALVRYQTAGTGPTVFHQTPRLTDIFTPRV